MSTPALSVRRRLTDPAEVWKPSRLCQTLADYLRSLEGRFLVPQSSSVRKAIEQDPGASAGACLAETMREAWKANGQGGGMTTKRQRADGLLKGCTCFRVVDPALQQPRH
jgi:hypothetical protein